MYCFSVTKFGAGTRDRILLQVGSSAVTNSRTALYVPDERTDSPLVQPLRRRWQSMTAA